MRYLILFFCLVFVFRRVTKEKSRQVQPPLSFSCHSCILLGVRAADKPRTSSLPRRRSPFRDFRQPLSERSRKSVSRDQRPGLVSGRLTAFGTLCLCSPVVFGRHASSLAVSSGRPSSPSPATEPQSACVDAGSTLLGAPAPPAAARSSRRGAPSLLLLLPPPLLPTAAL